MSATIGKSVRWAAMTVLAAVLASCGSEGPESGGGALANPISTAVTPSTDQVAAAESEPFCDSAVPVVDARVPLALEIDGLLELAEVTLSGDELSEFKHVSTDLRQVLVARGTKSYDTGDLAELVAEICGTEVRAIAGTS